MTRASYPLKLPASIKDAAARLAKEDGVSLNQWISVAIAQKIGAVETAAEFLKQRAGPAKPVDMLSFLDQAASETPPHGDEFESARSL
ncbi:MAG: pilus biosynthesis protein HicB [Blastomonas sp. CACIA14H2]|uniref:toxin-antitoxin system HicB family antitoxin n=1 Tax=Blastomonas sp. CACIA14H2 TaxID=1419876 RepID=UPI0003D0188A|nr:MAG: pilus biosynthesis protein HicB [Blastomonas sp. CACIA14H2]